MKDKDEIEQKVRDAFRKIEWIKVLSEAINSRPSSWGNDVVREWRNASDELEWAVTKALEQAGLLKPLFSTRTEKNLLKK